MRVRNAIPANASLLGLGLARGERLPCQVEVGRRLWSLAEAGRYGTFAGAVLGAMARSATEAD